ncbi:hypothetical protein Tiera_021 [Polaromonas phage Tiera]|nr:hypothetical protein Tiera_021 [Polaromonas phage Tiera]
MDLLNPLMDKLARERGYGTAMQQGQDIALQETTTGLSELLANIGADPAKQVTNAPVTVDTPSTSSNPDLVAILQEEAAKGLVAPAMAPAGSTPAAPAKKGPLPDPRDMSKVGDTKGGAARVNSRTAETGVSATTDNKGQVSLTNLGPATGSAEAVSGQTYKVNGNIGILQATEQLRKAPDMQTAEGILASIRSTAATEQARIGQEALSFASKKVGVPGLEAQLRQAEMADQADPKWYPGIGDSRITQEIRSQLNVARGQAITESEVYLKTNLSSGALKASLLNAEAAYNTVKGTAGRKEALQDNLDMRSAMKREEKEANSQDVLDATSPADIGFLKVLNPSLKNDSPIALAKAVMQLNSPAGASRMAAIKAASQPDGTDLLGLAMENNADAKTLLLAVEQSKNPLMDPAVISQKLDKVRQLASSKDFDSMVAKQLHPNDKKAQKEYVAAQAGKNLAGASTKEEKALAYKQKIGTAIQMVRQDATNEFVTNLSKWATTDPTWNDAVIKTQQAQGKTDFQSVMAEYVGSSTGVEALQKLQAVSAIASEATARQANSVFGKPEVAVLQRMISEKAKNIGIGQTIQNALSGIFSNVTQTGVISAVSPGMGLAVRAVSNPFWDSFKVKTDPVTGSPLN